MTSLLLIGAVLLIVSDLVKHGFFSTSRLNESKDALAAVQSIAQVLFIVLGAIFSYYRFFHGRTFVSRARVAIGIKVVDTSARVYLHYVTVELENLGTVTIWEPVPTLRARMIGPDGTREETVKEWRGATHHSGKGRGYAVVDSGETVSFTAYIEVAKSFWAVEYEAVVRDADDVEWTRGELVANKPDHDR